MSEVVEVAREEIRYYTIPPWVIALVVLGIVAGIVVAGSVLGGKGS